MVTLAECTRPPGCADRLAARLLVPDAQQVPAGRAAGAFLAARSSVQT